MNKKYMDFVPAKKHANASTTPPSARDLAPVGLRPFASQGASVTGLGRSFRAPLASGNSRPEGRAARTASGVGSASVPASSDIPYGVVEDYQPRFVKTEVKKRPLGKKTEAVKKAEEAKDALVDAKQQKLAGRAKILEQALLMAEEIGQEKQGRQEARAVKKAAKREGKRVTAPRFVNIDKIDKRPLSKNVYAKKVVVPKEEPKGPVTIIEKPEKDSKAGMVIAIILTIILGAAAGTVAFLLLPK